MVEHIKRKVPEMMKNFCDEDDSPYAKIIPLVLDKGIDNINLSMFDEEVRKGILNAVGEFCLEKGRLPDALKAFYKAGNNEKLSRVGDELKDMGKYDQALETYNLARDYGKIEF